MKADIEITFLFFVNYILFNTIKLLCKLLSAYSYQYCI